MSLTSLKENHPLFGRLCLSGPRWLAVNSQVGLRNAASKGVKPAQCLFLPNVVDTDHFTPATRQQTGTTRLLFAGRLAKEKRADLFLDVLAETRRMSPMTVQGVVAGDGPLLRAGCRNGPASLVCCQPASSFEGRCLTWRPFIGKLDILVLTSGLGGHAQCDPGSRCQRVAGRRNSCGRGPRMSFETAKQAFFVIAGCPGDFFDVNRVATNWRW